MLKNKISTATPVYVVQVIEAIRSFRSNVTIKLNTESNTDYSKMSGVMEYLLLQVFDYLKESEVDDFTHAIVSLKSVKVSTIKRLDVLNMKIDLNFDNHYVNRHKAYKIASKGSQLNAFREALYNCNESFTVISKSSLNLSENILDDLLMNEVLPDTGDSFIPVDILISNVKSIESKTKEIYGIKITNFQVKYHSDSSHFKKSIDQASAILRNLNISQLPLPEQKLKVIFNYLRSKIIYDTSLKRHSIYDALIKNRSVCSGISSAFCILCSLSGISTRIVSGQIDHTHHAWNLVRIRGKWYIVDVTWSLDNFYVSILPQMKYYLTAADSISTHKMNSKFYSTRFLLNSSLSNSNFKT